MYHILHCVTQLPQALHTGEGIAFNHKWLLPKHLSMLFLCCWLKLEEADSNPSCMQMGCETPDKLFTLSKGHFPSTIKMK